LAFHWNRGGTAIPHPNETKPIDTFCPTPSFRLEKDLIPTTLESFVELAIHDLISAQRLTIS
jgi:hypothetical protein